ncbi:hypothetical protein QTP70_034095, partial [Hemibagrus guttatus]
TLAAGGASGIRRATGLSGVTVPALSRTLVSSGIVTLRELVNITGSDLSKGERTWQRVWDCGPGVLSISSYTAGGLHLHQRSVPPPGVPERRGDGLWVSVGEAALQSLVKVLNKKKLSGRVDTPWRSVLGFNGDVKPEWRGLYKPPLTKKAADPPMEDFT